MLLMVQNGSIWFQNNTKYENGQNSPKQSWENNLIFEYIQIFWTNIFFAKLFVDFSWANLFGYSFVIFLSCQIYSDIHSSNIYGNEYIRIFIRPKILYSSHTAPVLEILWVSWYWSVASTPILKCCEYSNTVVLRALLYYSVPSTGLLRVL